MKIKNKYFSVETTDITTIPYMENIQVTVRCVYPYDYPDIDYFFRKQKRENRIKKIEDLFPEFKDESTDI